MAYIPGVLRSPIVRRRSFSRRFRAALRDTWVLMREFRPALILFSLTLLIGGLSFQVLWNLAYPANRVRFIEALYNVLGMSFFNPPIEFPPQWYLDLYFFLMPAFGLVFLSLGAADFVTLLFNRSSRQSQWEEAVASVYNDHIVVCGLGHLGLRVVRELVLWDEDIIVIERQENSPRIAEVRSYGIPVIVGDARHLDVLQKASIDRARAIVVCTNDDLSNLQMASRIRECNKSIRLVMRMFDDEFARSMADRLDIKAAFSASLLAAPAFAGAAAGVEIIQMFHIADKILAMGRIEIEPGSRLDGALVGDVEETLELSIVLQQSGTQVDVHLSPEHKLNPGDSIAVVGTPASIKQLAAHWNRPGLL